MTQAAVVNFGPEKHSVELREIDRPTIGPEDVLLEVAAVGVCGSDLHQWTAEHSWPVNYPVVLGHEFAGVVVEVGQRVQRLARRRPRRQRNGGRDRSRQPADSRKGFTISIRRARVLATASTAR